MKENQYGITLVALIITIIILIILATVSIKVVNDLGIIKYAVKGAEDYAKEEVRESEIMDEIEKAIRGEGLKENTKDTEAGTLVAIPEEWKTQTPSYINTENGIEVIGTKKIASVYAVSAGNGETIPVPINFYYVGGNLSTGVIISDNKEDRYENGKDKTTHEYAPNLKGNQFVWIPCSINDYHKTAFTKSTNLNDGWGISSQNAYYDTSTNSVEKAQVKKYGGFYVGRYEAGTSNIQGINFEEITTTGWNTDATLYTKVTSGNVTSKANEIPYYHTNYMTAVEMSERMYKNDNERNKYVDSGLMTGTMWDVMINLMNAKTGCDLSSNDWGNSLTLKDNMSITGCRGSHCEINTTNGGHGAWVTSNNYTKANNTSVILSTGASDFTQKMHIYDVAGNMWEWTQEMAFNKNDVEWFMTRGGSLRDNYHYPASFRAYHPATRTTTTIGFRVALYIK